ncbi:Sensor histidine kinase DesK [compost metagenome]
MRGTRLQDELFRIKQILKAAQIEFTLAGEADELDISLMNENVLGMCLKEAVTNIVKHSSATACSVVLEPARGEVVVRIKDNGIGVPSESVYYKGNGLRGMKERLEFVNGSMEIVSNGGTQLTIKVPSSLKQPVKEAPL